MYPIISNKFSAAQSWDCPESFGESGLGGLRSRAFLRGSDISTLGCGVASIVRIASGISVDVGATGSLSVVLVVGK